MEKIKTALAQAGVDSFHYSGNSFRIGAATTAAAYSVSDATIQLPGGGRVVATHVISGHHIKSLPQLLACLLVSDSQHMS